MQKFLGFLAIGLSLGFGMRNVLATETQSPVGNATLARDFFLCQSDHTGTNEVYSCREYRQDQQLVRFYFKGGNTPRAKATIRVTSNDVPVQVLQKPAEPLPPLAVLPPKGVPRAAEFIGSGVCLDSKDQSVPCGIFAHKPARFPKKFRYMVFYDANGKGATTIERQEAGPNPDAIPAELAYRIGKRLVESDCCQADGLGYLRYAMSLFPNFGVYRDAYVQYRRHLAVANTRPAEDA